MLQTYRKTVVSALPMSIMRWCDPRHHRQAAAAAPGGVGLAAGLSALRAALSRHAISTVLNTQLTLFQAEMCLAGQLARLLRSSAFIRRWEVLGAQDGEDADAL